jgi:hypothetical protein
MAVSSPSPLKRRMFEAIEENDGGLRSKWLSKPTPSIGTPRDLRPRTRL